MNAFHTTFYVDYLQSRFQMPGSEARILDIGCGGGKFLKFLHQCDESYFLFGLDHSPEMIALSQKINGKAIAKNRLKLIPGPATHLSMENDTLDLITAFETVQFWPETEKSFSEIHRVLHDGGTFLIINRYPRAGSKWWKLAKIKSDADYISLLQSAGFREIQVDMEYKKGWIIVTANK